MYDQIHLTGFKKFGGVDVNPTELIVDELSQHPISNVFVSKLDVTTDDVDNYIESKKKEQCESQKNLLNVHLGVGPNIVYFLENCAYNNKDFRIPDNSGKKFEKQKICHKLGLDQAIKTKLNLTKLKQNLSQKYKISISTDPGRYLCNYVYFNSLNQLKCERKNVDCLFIHFPGLNVTSHEQNMSFVKDFIQQVLKQQPLQNQLKKQNQ